MNKNPKCTKEVLLLYLTHFNTVQKSSYFNFQLIYVFLKLEAYLHNHMYVGRYSDFWHFFRFFVDVSTYVPCSSGFSSISSLDSLSKSLAYYWTQTQIFCLHSVGMKWTLQNERQISSQDCFVCFVLTENFTRAFKIFSCCLSLVSA